MCVITASVILSQQHQAILGGQGSIIDNFITECYVAMMLNFSKTETLDPHLPGPT